MKFVLAMLFPMAMTGSTFATVNCGSGPINGVSSASCSVPGTPAGSTSAFAFGSGIGVAVDAPFGVSVLATASAVADVGLFVDITGSTGTALFVPCFAGHGDNVLTTAIATVMGSIAGIGGGGSVSSSSDHNPIDSCGAGPPGFESAPSITFTFGQPFTFDVDLSGQAQVDSFFGGQVAGNLAINGYAVVDEASLNPIPGAIISVTETPEPNTALLMMLTLGLTIVMAFVRDRYDVKSDRGSGN